MRARRTARLLATIGFAVTVTSGPLAAQSASDFYKGKTVTIYTSAAGSTYDIYSRLVAQHYGKYIPGGPSVIVKNMPGAGGIRASNYLSGPAPKDGTALGIQNQTLPIAQVLTPGSVKFDMAAFNWIGLITDLTSTITVRSDAPATTIDDARRTAVIVGADGTGSGTYQIPTMLNVMLGTRFKVILGYKGIKAIDIAMNKGEVHGRYGSLLSWTSGHPDLVRDGKIRHLLQVTARQTPELSGVPTLISLARDDDERRIFRFISSQAGVARAVFTTPGVPAERVAALRDAFDKVMQDPALLARAKQAKLPIYPRPGSEVQRMIEEAVRIPEPLARKVRTAVGIR